MNKLVMASIFAVLPLQVASASQCTRDSDCSTGWCFNYTVPAVNNCPWWDIFCIPMEAVVAGECADEVVQLENEFSGECMRPDGGSQSVGVEVVLDTCANTASRDWGLFRLNDGTTMIVNSWSELCLTNSASDYFQEECDFASPPNSQQYVETTEQNGSNRLFQNVVGRDCVRGTTTGNHYIFESHNCDIHNNASRHWFYN
jgi:hypothetical protein